VERLMQTEHDRHLTGRRPSGSDVFGENIGPSLGSDTFLFRKSACACGGGCPSCQSKSSGLAISQPGDAAEIEADQIADRVMRMPAGSEAATVRTAASTGSIHRKCDECEEEEETIQRKPLSSGASSSSHNPGHVNSAISSGGHSLDRQSRSFFEPRFGRDLGGVRVHTGVEAGVSARAVNAQAYTLGNDIVFGQGAYSPESQSGRYLLAHELAHVVQGQEQSRPTIHRTITANSTCPANAHNAPADPIAELTADDERAQLMALGASNVLVLEALTFRDPIFGRSDVSNAYERRFGLPPAGTAGRFRNRFDAKQFATRDEAMEAEMLSLAERFERLHNFLAGNIRYRCPGTSSVTLTGCQPSTCGANTIAFSCPGGRQIAICPLFWTDPMMQSVDQRGGNMIHESVHMRFQFANHGLATAAQRGQNSECYAAFIADIYGFQSDDTTDCTPLIP